VRRVRVVDVAGAKVIIACRDVKKAEQAVADIVAEVKGDKLGQLAVEELDLASFASIKRCAKSILQKEERIHLLVNNAGQSIRSPIFLVVETQDPNRKRVQSHETF